MAESSAVLTSAPLLADLDRLGMGRSGGGRAARALAVIVAVCWLRPYWPLRVFLWLVTHSLYWLRVLGRDNVPAKGAALLVCNHVSYVDWLLLLASQRRFIRFVVWAGFTKKWGLRRLLQWGGCIPIDGAAGPRAVVKSLRAASDALARGELVCIFAEGRFTQNGFMLPFHRGFEQIVKHCQAPVIPVCLDQVWGSIFSFYGGQIFWKLPLDIPYHVTVAFGQPMPNDSEGGRRAPGGAEAVGRLFRRSRARSACRSTASSCAWPSGGRSVPASTTASPSGKGLSYGMTLTGAMLLARLLRPMLGDAPMVGVWLPPGIGGAVVNIALAFLGKTSVNLNYTSGAGFAALGPAPVRLQIRPHLQAVPPQGQAGTRPRRRADLPRRLPGESIQKPAHMGVYPDAADADVRAGALGAGPGASTRVDDLATVIFSSGSTGEPKGVMLTHGNIAANVESMIQAAGLEARDRALGVLPFFHSFGYTVTLWAPLQVGASTVYHADPRQAKEIGELCRKHRCTLFLSTATFLRFCLRKCEPDDFKTLRILMCGAEKLPQTLAQEFEKKFGVLPLEGYGCTELSPVAAANVPDKVIAGFRQIGNKPGTVGQPVPGVAARTVDPETMRDRCRSARRACC